MTDLTQPQEAAILCAYVDLQGILNTFDKYDSIWKQYDRTAIENSMGDLENAFPEIIENGVREDE